MIQSQARLGSLPNPGPPHLLPRNPSVESFVENGMPELTQARVKELFDYDPDTGVVTRKITVAYNARKGSVITSINDQGYLRVGIDGKGNRLHRIIWLWVYGCFPIEVDHGKSI